MAKKPKREWAGHKNSKQIQAQCKAAGIHFGDKLYNEEGSDYIVVTTRKGDNYSGQVLYNVVNGTFFGTTPRVWPEHPEWENVEINSNYAFHDDTPWMQALLAFFLVPKA